MIPTVTRAELKIFDNIEFCFEHSSLIVSFLFKFISLLWPKSFSLLSRQSWRMEEQTLFKFY